MSRKSIFFIIIFLIVLFEVSLFSYKVFHKYPVVNSEFEITNETGSIPVFIDSVVLENQMQNRYWKYYLRMFKYDTRLKSGVYSMTSEKVSRADIIKMLVSGPPKKETQTLTFIEGWTNGDVIEYLKTQDIRLDDVIAESTVQDYRAGYDFLQNAPAKASLEGYLFPNTYEIFISATEEDIMLKMLDEFDKRLTDDMRAEIKKTGRTVHDVLIMASLLEKEVRQRKTMQVVAGIFYNRLEIGMRLQSDATVNYITQSGRSRSTLKDLEIDSPYNTYKYKGLPPGPIANPGFDALYAAVYPTETSYMYFLTTEEGVIHYARTFNEHVRNKQLYLD